jgi:hypothetical protein
MSVLVSCPALRGVDESSSDSAPTVVWVDDECSENGDGTVGMEHCDDVDGRKPDQKVSSVGEEYGNIRLVSEVF